MLMPVAAGLPTGELLDDHDDNTSISALLTYLDSGNIYVDMGSFGVFTGGI